MKKHFLVFLILVGCLMLQGQDRPFGPTRIALPSGTTLPAACAADIEVFIDTDATPAGQQVYLCNTAGNGWNLIGDGGGAPATLSGMMALQEEFCTVSTDISGERFGTTSSYFLKDQAGTGALASNISPTATAVCFWQIASGATSGNSSSFQSGPANNTNTLPGADSTLAVFETRFSLDSATDSYFCIGLAPHSGTDDCLSHANSIFCDVTNGAGAGNWACHTRSSSSQSDLTVTPTQTADTSEHVVRMEITSSNVEFFFDGTSVGSITTNIPTVAMSVIHQAETSTTGAKSLSVDGWLYRKAR